MKNDKYDRVFSNIIRTRDNWRCQRCHMQYTPPTKALHNSHYFGRTRLSTRFDEQNCDALCHGCHRHWEVTDRESYRAFKIKQLGENGFNALHVRSWETCRKSGIYNKVYYLALKIRYKEVNEKYQQTTLC